MSIYKIALLNSSNKLVKYHVFSGQSILPELETIFSSDELERIASEDIEIMNIDSILHMDDTIETVKKKIILGTGFNYSFEEMYLFVENMSVIDVSQLYANLSYNGKLDIHPSSLKQYMVNNNIEHLDTLGRDISYIDYDDIIQLNINKLSVIQKKPLGMKLITGDAVYSMYVNPFQILYINKLLSESVENLVSTTNKTLLMNSGFINNNTIYLCLADNVLNYAKTHGFNENVIIKLYFTYLHEKKIYDLETFEAKKEGLIKATRKLVSAKFEKNIENVDLFYNIYNNNPDSTKYLYQGITRAQVVLYQENEFFIPLDVIFKIISTSDDMPLTKLNASKKRETIFRLYCPETAKGGRKIPSLSKAHVIKINKATPHSGRVSMYMKKRIQDQDVIIICEIDTSANIHIHVQSKKNFDMLEIRDIIRENVNPIINIIKNYIEQSGYKMSAFDSFYDDNVEIIDMNYVCYLEISKNIQLRKILGCVSSIFSVENSNLKDGIVMRFKRVANFNEMDSIQSFISDLYNKETQEDIIISMLIENFQLSEEESQLKLIDYLNGVQVVQNMNRRKSMRSKDNPGFLTTITQDQFQSNITIRIDGINNIRYYETLPIYIDSLIQLTQNPPAKYAESIKKLCTGRQEKKLEEMVDIIAPSEQNRDIYDPIAFGESEGNSPNESDNILDLLIQDDSDDDDDESDDDVFAGGNDDDTPSPVSIELIDSSPEASPEASPDASPEASPDAFDIDIISDTPESIPEARPDAYPDASPDAIDIDILGSSTPQSSPDAIDVDILADTPLASPEASPDAIEVDIVTDTPFASPQASPEKVIDNKSVEKVVVEHEEEQPEEEQPEEEQDETLVKDITGMSLSFPNPFFQRLEKRDPKLYVSTQQGKFNAYSRSCQWNKRRQPVILTDAEKERIDKEHPGSYDQAMKYGSSPDKKFWYICPRYWDLKKDTSLTEADVKSGDYGEVIDIKATKVPKDKFVFEFNDGKEHLDTKTGKYVNYNPGFLKSNVHPDGLCVPCCFKTWNLPNQVKRKSQCLNDDVDIKTDRIDTDVNKAKTYEIDEYVKGPEKMPLESGRIGYLPNPIQRFLNFDNKTCYVSSKNTNLKPNTRCVLRYGIETSKTRSFIACVADAFSDFEENKEILSISGFIKHIKNKDSGILTIDTFSYYQNGSLMNTFYNPDKEVQIDEYPNSIAYKSMNKSNENERDALLRLINSYNNFLDYLDNPDSQLDYMYMWDIICTPNPSLFYNGLNIVIMDIPSDDTTNNISIICPTSHYSHSLFDIKKPTLFLVKKYEYYEPLYIIEDSHDGNKTTRSFERLFTYGNSTNPPGINDSLKEFETMFKTMCAPLNSIPSEYKFKTNITAKLAHEELEKEDYVVEKQVLNFHSKVVGLYCSKGEIEGFIPTLPSGQLVGIDTVYFNDSSLWSTYLDTVEFLTRVHKETSGRIMSAPHSKVLEDNMIVGIVTETNQFVELSAPEPNQYDGDGLKIIDSTSYNKVDIDTQLSTVKDVERIEYVKKIKLESGFYNAFRNTLRSLLNNYQYISLRKGIESISNSVGVLYVYKLERIVEMLHTLMDDHVVFVSFENMDFDEIFGCLNTSEELCASRKYCRYENDTCRLLLPQENLLNGQNNDKMYFGRLADELVRYNRIKMFIFEPKMYLSFNDLKYNLHENEIILLQSLVVGDYFDDLVPETHNSYIKHISYDNAEPYITQSYSNVYSDVASIDADLPSIEEAVIKESSCTPKRKNIYGNLRALLPSDFKELFYYSPTPKCSFQVIIDVMENANIFKTMNEIRDELINIYKPLLAKYVGQLVDYWKQYGMKDLADILINKKATLEDIISSEHYGLTTLDIWLLSEKFDLPVILFSATKFSENNQPILRVNPNIKLKFYLIQPHMRYSNNTRVKLIENNKDNILIEQHDITPEFVELLSKSQYTSGMEYLKTYKRPVIVRNKRPLQIK